MMKYYVIIFLQLQLKNATESLIIQNKIIEICGGIIRNEICDRVYDVTMCFSVLADGTTEVLGNLSGIENLLILIIHKKTINRKKQNKINVVLSERKKFYGRKYFHRI